MTFRISMSRPGGAWLAAMTFLLMLQSRYSCAGAGYVLTDLGPGTASSINNSGKILVNNEGNAYMVDGSTRLPLTNILATAVHATDINDAGRIVGISEYFGGTRKGVFSIDLTGNPSAPFSTNTFVDFGGQEHRDEYVAVNNNGGLVVLSYLQDVKISWYDSFPIFPGNFTTTRRDINDSGVSAGSIGQIAGGGIGNPAYARSRQACFFTAGNEVVVIDPRTVSIWSSSVALSEAMAINGQGHIAGYMRADVSSPRTAFRYVDQAGGMESLGSLGGSESQALAINDAGQIVGEAVDGTGGKKAFLWENGTMKDINSLLQPGTGWTLTSATAINNHGRIVGYGQFQGSQRAFLLSPSDSGIAPTLTSQPESNTVSLGSSLTLTVSALGSQPIFYQWQRYGTNLVGQTNASLILTNINGLSSGDYRVVVSNLAGSVISSIATVGVKDPETTITVYVAVTINGQIGGTYELQVLEQFQPQTWKTVATTTLTNVSQTYFDYETPNHSTRIYRAIRIQ